MKGQSRPGVRIRIPGRCSTCGRWPRKFKIDPDKPLKRLTPEQLRGHRYTGPRDEKIEISYQGPDREFRHSAAFEGVAHNLERRYRETQSEFMRREIEKFMSVKPCTACQGARLKKESLSVLIGGLNISQFTAFSVRKRRNFLNGLEFTGTGEDHCPAGIKGDQRTVGLFNQCRPGLSDPGPGRRDPLRRRSAADPPGHPDRFFAGGGFVYPG